MGSPMRLDRCHTTLFDHGVNVNIPEHTAVRTFSSEHRLRDLLKAQPCGGVRVQIERKRNCRAAAGEGCQGKNTGCKEHRGCEEHHAARPFLSRPQLGALLGLGLGNASHFGTVFKASVSQHFPAINNLPFVIFQGSLCLYSY